ncbi:MAG: hypothetical protein PHT69_07715 [Bacteroidales bacterium]|nr:hypothetical protein [Bacteroidales bacterium]
MKISYCVKVFTRIILCNLTVIFVFFTFDTKAQPDDFNCTCATCGKSCSEISRSGHVRGMSCDNSGSSSSSSNAVDFSFTNPIISGFQLGVISGLAGGLLVHSKTGKELWLEGAALGFGVGSMIALFNSMNKRSLAANIGLGLLSGSVNGYAAGELEKAFTEPTAPVIPDNTVKYIVIGALAETALVTTISLIRPTKGGYSQRINNNNFLEKMNVNFYGNRIGLSLKL